MKAPRSDNAARAGLVTEPEAVGRIWESPHWQPVFRHLEELEPWLQQEQMELTAVAAPTHFEGLRAEWLLRRWQGLGLAAGLDEAGNVVAERPGGDADAPRLALTAHLDTAFPPGTAAQPERRGGRIWAPGISDNGAGLAALLGLAHTLQHWQIATRRPLLFVANVGEEGEGDLKGMRHLFRSGGPWADRIGWTLVVDGPGMDQITTSALPSRRLRVSLEGPGGHSWSDLGRASAVHAALRIGAALLAQVRPEAEVLGCNVGWMQGGSAVNAIAAEAQLKLDLRSREGKDLEELTRAVRRAVAAGLEQENQAALSGQVEARLETIGERPGGTLAEGSPLLQCVRQADAALGIAAEQQTASTDANIPLSQGREAVRVGAGGRGGGIHTLQEWFDPRGRSRALQRILLVVLALSQAQPPGSASAPPAARPRRRRA